MIVYVATTGFDHEGEDLIGVYASLEDAQKAFSDIERDFCDGLNVYAVKLGEKAEELPTWTLRRKRRQ